VLTAVHAHDAPAVTVSVAVAASFENAAEAGEIAIVQGSVPACVTATGCPAIVSVPLRASGFAFAVTLTATVPDPVPAPLPTLTQPRSDAAVHAHPAVVVTVTDALPPDAPNVRADWDRVNVHAAGGVGSVGDFVSHAQMAASAATIVMTPPEAMQERHRITTSGTQESKPAASAAHVFCGTSR
jgi:hypothetical protein